MKSLLLGLVLAMSAALPATAGEWVYIGSTEYGGDFSIDTESITQINGGYAFKELLANKRENVYMVNNIQLLCRERVLRRNAYESYTADGQLIRRLQLPDEPFDLIAVNTAHSVIWERLCN